MSETFETFKVEVDPEALRRRLERQRVVEFSDVDMLFALIESEQERRLRAEAGAAVLHRALSNAMELLPGGTPTDLEPRVYRIVSECDAALECPSGAALLAELDAARRVIRATRSYPNRLMMDALITYDAVAHAGADLPTPPWTALLGAVQAVVRTWQALSRCEDEFLPEQPGACSEWPGALDESIAELELAMEEVTKGTIR